MAQRDAKLPGQFSASLPHLRLSQVNRISLSTPVSSISSHCNKKKEKKKHFFPCLFHNKEEESLIKR